jgi:hypothetical protein
VYQDNAMSWSFSLLREVSSHDIHWRLFAVIKNVTISAFEYLAYLLENQKSMMVSELVHRALLLLYAVWWGPTS